MPSERLKRLRRNVDNIPWGEIGIMGRESIWRTFDVESRHRYRKWKERKDNKPHPILNKSGNLRNTLYVEPENNAVVIGSRVIYAAVHNFGFPARNIPQRKFLKLLKGDLKEMRAKIKRHLRSGTK